MCTRIFYVLAAMLLKIRVFWRVTSCRNVSNFVSFLASVLLGLLSPEDEQKMVFWNLWNHSPNDTGLHLRKSELLFCFESRLQNWVKRLLDAPVYIPLCPSVCPSGHPFGSTPHPLYGFSWFFKFIFGKYVEKITIILKSEKITRCCRFVHFSIWNTW